MADGKGGRGAGRGATGSVVAGVAGPGNAVPARLRPVGIYVMDAWKAYNRGREDAFREAVELAGRAVERDVTAQLTDPTTALSPSLHRDSFAAWTEPSPNVAFRAFYPRVDVVGKYNPGARAWDVRVSAGAERRSLAVPGTMQYSPSWKFPAEGVTRIASLAAAAMRAHLAARYRDPAMRDL